MNRIKSQFQETENLNQNIPEESLEEKINQISEKLEELDSIFSLTKQLENIIIEEKQNASEIYSNSIIVLISGILVSMLSVFLWLYFTPKEGELLALSSIKLFFGLVFIQGIAWFLFRQYRLLMEDYKIFKSDYQKRTSQLIAILYSEMTLATPKNDPIIDSILKFPDRNAKVDVELVKNLDRGPSEKILDVLKTYIAKVK